MLKVITRMSDMCSSSAHGCPMGEGSQPIQTGGDDRLPAIAHVDVILQADVPYQVLDTAQVAERRQDAFGVGRQGPRRPVAGKQRSTQRGKVWVLLYLKGSDGQIIEERGIAAVVKVEQVDLPVMEQVVPLVQVGVDQPVGVR